MILVCLARLFTNTNSESGIPGGEKGNSNFSLKIRLTKKNMNQLLRRTSTKGKIPWFEFKTRHFRPPPSYFSFSFNPFLLFPPPPPPSFFALLPLGTSVVSISQMFNSQTARRPFAANHLHLMDMSKRQK